MVLRHTVKKDTHTAESIYPRHSTSSVLLKAKRLRCPATQQIHILSSAWDQDLVLCSIANQTFIVRRVTLTFLKFK